MAEDNVVTIPKPEPPKTKFVIGDVVRLTCTDIVMTVTGVGGKAKRLISVAWLDDMSGLNEAEFDADALVPANFQLEDIDDEVIDGTDQ